VINQQVFTNAQIVLRNEVIHGTVVVESGKIVDVSEVMIDASGVIDCQGDYLIPGLVELHTDNLERHMKPRPGVKWPPIPAVLGHDAQVVAAGITTVLDAIALGEVNDGAQRVGLLSSMTSAIDTAREQGLLRAEHLLHLRCEVVYPELLTLWEQFRESPALRLVSLMDHSPGQRQFVKIDKYHEYYQGKYSLSDAEMAAFIERQLANAEQYSDKHRQIVSADCRERGIALASHDDATITHANESAALGMMVAEFPTTEEAARVSHENGLKVMMGAPNVVRGLSHSGNVSARELASLGLVDVLSSDYVPSSLLLAAFTLSQLIDNISLPQAISMVTAGPAKAIGLSDRGEIVSGKRADLVRVGLFEDIPLVKGTWVAGLQVY
jgi:alpha-D-ribose 1-methylphosphonate 5-triphosphate diphosphatase